MSSFSKPRFSWAWAYGLVLVWLLVLIVGLMRFSHAFA